MPAPLDHYTNILRFWRSIETFTLPDLGRIRSEDICTVLSPGDPLPWENQRAPRANTSEVGETQPPFPSPAEGRRWRHTLYFHIVEKEMIIADLARRTSSSEYRDPVSGITCLSALVVDQNGRPGLRSYAPAAFVYAMKLIRQRHNPEELTELLRKAQDAWQPRFAIKPEEEPMPLTWPALKKELAYLRRITANTLPATAQILCISEQTSPTAGLEAPFLNSYYIRDLDTLIRHPRNHGLPLRQFLTPQIDIAARKDLLDPHLLIQYLHPRYMPAARWPANPAHGLYSAQLAALNITLSANPAALTGINGPPGTGKTTLLREIIADAVVTRAKRLLDARVDNLFYGHRKPISDYAHYYEIDKTVFGNDGIVVASNNNTAIENISRELPQVTSIDIDTFPEAEYFSLMATAMNGMPSWGMISAVLGRSGNRADFVGKFWFNKGKSFNRHLREMVDEADSAIHNFAAVARELKSLLKEYAQFQNRAAACHDAVVNGKAHQELANYLISEYAIDPQNLPGPDFTNLSSTVIHRMTPYSSEKVNTLRSNIFLRSLELHEWAIRANPRYFQSNLSMFVDLVANKHLDKINEHIAATLWNTFFFCIPVVSVTLASLARQFSKLQAGFIGWLLLDEAGQAALPSVCGALWRSKRSILIGDTLQIPPVVTIPEALGRLLQQPYGIFDQTWSPICQSAQSLADRVTLIGAWLDPTKTANTNQNQPTWTGIPLRAHRRCDEPMFSIANTIAYNNQMVQVTSAMPAYDAPPSSWIHVEGYTNDGHTIAEELDAVEALLQQLVNCPGKIFIISPFRTIAEACKERFTQKNKIDCGTIHTFQGREVENVLLVLGTLPANLKARQWVAATPNILNVAITRARRRLYVIGNRRIWSAHRYFDHLAKSLPSMPHLPGTRLF